MENLLKLLDNMVQILEKEKSMLLENRGEELEAIVEEKTRFLTLLEEYKGKDFSKDKIVVEKIEEIHELQKTNLLLINQGMDFFNQFFEIVQDAVKDQTAGYSVDGKILVKNNANIIDQSI